MADPQLITTHIIDGLRRLLVQFRGRPNISGVLESYLTQVQEIENVGISLISLRYVDNAEGVQLDGVGSIVGEARAGRDDTDYRVAIKGRIRGNAANSRIEDILDLFVLLLPGFTFTLTEGTEASFSLTINEALPSTAASPGALNEQLQRAKGAGIRANLIYSELDPGLRFTFAPGDALEPSNDQGYADDSPTTIGGRYVDVAD